MFKNEVHHVVIYQFALELESVHVNFSRKLHEKPAIRIQISILALQAVITFSRTVPLDSNSNFPHAFLTEVLLFLGIMDLK